jgi:hypothetical protein
MIDNGIHGVGDTMSFNRMPSTSIPYKKLMRRRGEETFSQFARIDSGFLAWDFWLKDKQDRKQSPSLGVISNG